MTIEKYVSFHLNFLPNKFTLLISRHDQKINYKQLNEEKDDSKLQNSSQTFLSQHL